MSFLFKRRNIKEGKEKASIIIFLLAMFVERINSVGLKRELANSLGPTVAPLYWKTLKAFVKAKISKLELDLFLSSNLSQKNSNFFFFFFVSFSWILKY